ncbi:hypothetical protein AgCh_000728 [Apium graveolens]
MDWIRNKLGFEGLISVDCQGRSGGIFLLWKKEHSTHLLIFSKHHINVEVNTADNQPWRLTGFYGEPDIAQRRKTWDLLRNSARDSNSPWCIIGDLNNIVSQADKHGGSRYPQWLIDGFNETINDIGLYDMNLNEEGAWVDWDNRLSELIFNYFIELYKTAGSNYREIIHWIPTSISAIQNEELFLPISAKEVKVALFQMNPDKSPGPDGMTPGFYQKYWKIVGPDVVNMVIVNMMKGMLKIVISKNQSALIAGRQISDNVMMSYEIMHYLKRKKRGADGFIALELDMSKAFDRVEWEYLRAVLTKMGFNEKWVNLISKCVS